MPLDFSLSQWDIVPFVERFSIASCEEIPLFRFVNQDEESAVKLLWHKRHALLEST